jgi:ABC-type lipoprotein release transport system permease subunit
VEQAAGGYAGRSDSLLGLVAYAVSERTKEIAIRIALGARPGHVLSAILRQFVWPVALGLLAA